MLYLVGVALLVIIICFVYKYNALEKCFMFYHYCAIRYHIWKASRALRRINKSDIADALRFDDQWRK